MTQYGYDWRDRQTYAVGPFADGQSTPISYAMTTYDNLDEATTSQQWQLVGVNSSSAIRTLLNSAAAESGGVRPTLDIRN